MMRKQRQQGWLKAELKAKVVSNDDDNANKDGQRLTLCPFDTSRAMLKPEGQQKIEERDCLSSKSGHPKGEERKKARRRFGGNAKYLYLLWAARESGNGRCIRKRALRCRCEGGRPCRHGSLIGQGVGGRCVTTASMLERRRARSRWPLEEVVGGKSEVSRVLREPSWILTTHGDRGRMRGGQACGPARRLAAFRSLAFALGARSQLRDLTMLARELQ
ncbi:hypothetical protein BDY17DRAFT_28809 [Neohortaea acidophila]|uniref:Uncharacterized protein n=1 Tax=Neohortaea acidophila TaxID=245834 RepID=A0A6A6PIR7_9PEZI|nr:uncharacterized protein BDY17DRAFT_28809 [Neohortaea acidophila]KAF2479938.1 hypothetical protein BDY17DRAFT_28809 [Neohortaea acidophila]